MRSRKLAPRRRTHLPNASTIGYGTYYALPGDYIQYWEGPYSDGTRRLAFARVLGQIVETQHDGLEDCRGWLCVARLSEDLAGGFERWVNPVDVHTCQRPARVDAFLAAFLAASIDDTLECIAANDGFIADGRDGKLWTGSEAQNEASRVWANRTSSRSTHGR